MEIYKYLNIFTTDSNKCKVYNCNESHSNHYCCKCNDTDSNHKSKNCKLKNAAIFMINTNGWVLLLRDIKDHQWMIPGGKIEENESALNGAIREFNEETGFEYDPKFNQIINTYKVNHSSGSQTQIFIVKSNQLFGTFRGTNETDAIYFIKLHKLKNMIINNTEHHTVKKLKKYVIKSTNELIKQNLI